MEGHYSEVRGVFILNKEDRPALIIYDASLSQTEGLALRRHPVKCSNRVLTSKY